MTKRTGVYFLSGHPVFALEWMWYKTSVAVIVQDANAMFCRLRCNTLLCDMHASC